MFWIGSKKREEQIVSGDWIIELLKSRVRFDCSSKGLQLDFALKNKDVSYENKQTQLICQSLNLIET